MTEHAKMEYDAGRALQGQSAETIIQDEKPGPGLDAKMFDRAAEAMRPSVGACEMAARVDHCSGGHVLAMHAREAMEACKKGAPGDAVGPISAWSPGNQTCDILKKSPLQNPLDGRQYRTELIHRSSGVRVERHWDRDIAYLDILRFSAGARIDFREWPLGDGLERCFRAHEAVGPGIRSTGTPVFHYIHHLEVQPAARRRGIGRELLNVVLTSIREVEERPWIWLCANGILDGKIMDWYEVSGFRRLSTVTTIMYWDYRYPEHIKLDPKKAAEIPYVARS